MQEDTNSSTGAAKKGFTFQNHHLREQETPSSCSFTLSLVPWRLEVWVMLKQACLRSHTHLHLRKPNPKYRQALPTIRRSESHVKGSPLLNIISSIPSIREAPNHPHLDLGGELFGDSSGGAGGGTGGAAGGECGE